MIYNQQKYTKPITTYVNCWKWGPLKTIKVHVVTTVALTTNPKFWSTSHSVTWPNFLNRLLMSSLVMPSTSRPTNILVGISHFPHSTLKQTQKPTNKLSWQKKGHNNYWELPVPKIYRNLYLKLYQKIPTLTLTILTVTLGIDFST